MSDLIDEALAGVEATIYSNDIVPKQNIMSNYPRLPSWPVVKRSYEKPLCLYYAVFKPFNKNYDPEFDGIDHIRKKVNRFTKTENMIITREINEAKIHYNVMFWTLNPECESFFHEKKTNRYYIHCQKAPLSDKYKIHEYIVKESMTRFFKKKDIYIR